ncbi:MAG: tRNA pseudouridine(13) synthase TruD [Marinicella sp.]|nr:tRNA pseudouridine(13) synthase TruD [Xanthomonadales bacterium]
MISVFNQLFPTLNHVDATGKIRILPEDFVVIEHNDVVFSGQGEHWWIQLEKTNSNTAWAATQLASACKVPARQVGYAGLKDRHAITRQWFSVQLPKIKDINEVCEKLPPEIRILNHYWHQSKIKKGQLKGNQFEILIRDFIGNKEQVENNIKSIQTHGVPNYFGPQRFGHKMNNIQKVQDWFAGHIKVNNRNLRGLLISCARSHLFNLIIAKRIENDTWNQVIEGDIMQLDGSHSWFHAKDASKCELSQRLNEFDIHITAAMWGENPVQSTATCAQFEQKIADSIPIYHKGFEQFRVSQDRRAVRLLPQQLSFSWQGSNLLLKFALPSGCYATSVLRELVRCEQNETESSD